MKINILILISFSLVLVFPFFSKSQDTIILKNGVKIVAKVLEVGAAEIQYKTSDVRETIIYTLKKSSVSMIKYPNGAQDVFISPNETPLKPISSNRFSFKVNLLQLLFSEARGLIEIPFKNNSSIELTGSYLYGTTQTGLMGNGYKIGLGFRDHFDSGIFLNPTFFYMNSIFTNSTLTTSGNYLTFAKQPYQPYDFTKQVYSLQVLMGKKFIFANSIVLEIYWGVGGRIRTYSITYTYPAYGSNHPFYKEPIPNAFNPTVHFGINFGFQ